MSNRPKAIAYDVDATSLLSLRQARPGWQIQALNRATPAFVAGTWRRGAADLLVVGAHGDDTATLRVCRLLTAHPGSWEGLRREPRSGPKQDGWPCDRAAPLLVLVSAGEETPVGAALEAGAHSCLVRPIHPQDVVRMLAHARAGTQSGRHTLGLEGVQGADAWRDDGGEA